MFHLLPRETGNIVHSFQSTAENKLGSFIMAAVRTVFFWKIIFWKLCLSYLCCQYGGQCGCDFVVGIYIFLGTKKALSSIKWGLQLYACWLLPNTFYNEINKSVDVNNFRFLLYNIQVFWWLGTPNFFSKIWILFPWQNSIFQFTFS